MSPEYVKMDPDRHGWTSVENWQEEATIDFLLLFGCRISTVYEEEIELGDTPVFPSPPKLEIDL